MLWVISQPPRDTINNFGKSSNFYENNKVCEVMLIGIYVFICHLFHLRDQIKQRAAQKFQFIFRPTQSYPLRFWIVLPIVSTISNVYDPD